MITETVWYLGYEIEVCNRDFLIYAPNRDVACFPSMTSAVVDQASPQKPWHTAREGRWSNEFGWRGTESCAPSAAGRTRTGKDDEPAMSRGRVSCSAPKIF